MAVFGTGVPVKLLITPPDTNWAFFGVAAAARVLRILRCIISDINKNARFGVT